MCASGYILREQFNWNDDIGSGEYSWGCDGSLKMDGATGPIGCSRYLTDRITDERGTVELGLRFTRGRQYLVCMYDSADRMVVECILGSTGTIRFHDGTTAVDSGASTGRAPHLWCGTSDEHILRFGRFDFQARTLTFTFDGEEHAGMPLRGGGDDGSMIQLRTPATERGNTIWLNHYAQFHGAERTDYQDFGHCWQPMSLLAQDRGAGQGTTCRPRDYKWLEVATVYGAVHTSMPAVVAGSVELDMMTADVRQETQLTVGEYRRTESPQDGWWGACVAIFGGLWSPCTSFIRARSTASVKGTESTPVVFGYFKPFDKAPCAVNNRPYRVKLQWDVPTQTYRVWIDGVLQEYEGSPDLHFINPVSEGVDALVIHPGNLNPYVGPELYTYWGNVTVTAE